MRDEAALRQKLGGGGGGVGVGSGGSVWEPVLPVASQAVWIDKELVDDLVRSSIFTMCHYVVSIELSLCRCGVELQRRQPLLAHQTFAQWLSNTALFSIRCEAAAAASRHKCMWSNTSTRWM
jgi:hypothetical protein